MGSLHSWTRDASNDELIAVAQADPRNDSTAMNEMVRRFEGKALKIANGLTGDTHLRQDAANAARWGVVKAVRAHRRGVPGFPSYVELTMRGEASRACARAYDRGEIPIECDSTVWHVAAPVHDGISALESELALLLKGLSHEQRGLTWARYAHGYGTSELAAGLGISVSAVSQRFKTIHRLVRDNVATCREAA